MFQKIFRLLIAAVLLILALKVPRKSCWVVAAQPSFRRMSCLREYPQSLIKYYSALRFICGDLNSGNGIVMQELEQLKGKEINILRLERGSWGWRILLVHALIFMLKKVSVQLSISFFFSPSPVEQNRNSGSKICFSCI